MKRFQGRRHIFANGVVMLGLVLMLTGCSGSLLDFNLFIVGEQTSLEKQVLGTYSSLGEDLLVYSSVRGVDEEGNLRLPPETTESERTAFEAMRNREYNRDDIELILRTGVAGETNDGKLVPREGNLSATGLSRETIVRIFEEENNDRETILNRLMQTADGGTENAEEISWIFATLNHDLAPEGSWIQRRDGSWSRK